MYFIKMVEGLNADFIFECPTVEDAIRNLGFGPIDIVRVVTDPRLRMVVDDCGLLRDDSEMNLTATAMYGANGIVGDALLVRVNDDGDDITGWDCYDDVKHQYVLMEAQLVKWHSIDD